jgi:prolyl-tRNA synthetase
VRWSQAFIPTLRDDPADAEAQSHKLLVRGGFIRQLATGMYVLLPLAHRTCQKIIHIVRQEMEGIGGQEFMMPALHPKEIWEKSGRWETMGAEMFRLRDRKEADLCLGMTHEEIFTHVGVELKSYKQLPQIWFQIQTKFRDEARPKSGILRTREFRMKDAYSFDIDQAGLDHAFDQHHAAYRQIFKRCGLDPMAVEASAGAMGGGDSIEFMVPSDAGEDLIATCEKCGYAANLEKATSELPNLENAAALDAAEKFATPGVGTIEEVAAFDGGAAAEHQIKTLVYMFDERLVLILLRGDHALSEQKLVDGVEVSEFRPAAEEEIRKVLGAKPGSLGPLRAQLPEEVDGKKVLILADPALEGRVGMVCGANDDGHHYRGVDLARDVAVDHWLDMREVRTGEGCPLCSTPLAVCKTIEIGHIFKLGTRYSESMGLKVLDKNGKAQNVIMGSYGIGMERLMASVVETSCDDKGISWPVSVAPYEVVICVVKAKDIEVLEAGERIYDALIAAGIDVILDDRLDNPGVKFKDAELVGIPYRIVVGPRSLKEGKVEIVRRRDGDKREVAIEHAAEEVGEEVVSERKRRA